MKLAERFDLILALGGLFLLVLHVYHTPNPLEILGPQSLYEIHFESTFENEDGDVEVETYIPTTTENQAVLTESVMSDGMDGQISLEESGRKLVWTGGEESREAEYLVSVRMQGVEFEIDPNFPITADTDNSFEEYLKETEYIQVSHPEIIQLWESIKPAKQTMLETLKAIYDYTYEEIHTVPFKGTTDALTTLRLGIASCNGKSRLFVALARLNGIPARLIGGLILKPGKKKTSHQWVEVFVDGHWIPFGPTNGYFAKKPTHYLKLYQGDQALFRHTSNIGFDYSFDIEKRTLSSAFIVNSETPSDVWNLASVLSSLKLSPQTVAILLLFPLCTLLITFLRNVIGVKTFGIFMPMLIAATCLYTGPMKGLIGFGLIIVVATIFHGLLDRLRILKTARLASVITLVTLCFILVLVLSDEETRIELGILSLFPIVIITFISERVYQTLQVKDTNEVITTSLGTIFTLLICYFYMKSIMVQSAFSYFPSLYLLVLSAQLYIGKWSGIRLSELIRFKTPIINTPNDVIGINARNRDLVYKLNDKSLLNLAADKLATKRALQSWDVPVADNIAVVENYSDLKSLPDIFDKHHEFVIKPNQGSQGNGIVVISDKKEVNGKQCFLSAGGAYWDRGELQAHIKDILAGTYSQSGLSDSAYIEPLIKQDERINQLAPFGLSDIRIVLVNGQLISAMLRMPTKQSSGKANLHQGAIGVAIDMSNGLTIHGRLKGKSISHHPDSGESILDISIPYWHSIKEMALRCYKAVPLGYLGVDICLDEELGPLVLEVNGRPGLEIQNVHGKGFGAEIRTALA